MEFFFIGRCIVDPILVKGASPGAVLFPLPDNASRRFNPSQTLAVEPASVNESTNIRLQNAPDQVTLSDASTQELLTNSNRILQQVDMIENRLPAGARKDSSGGDMVPEQSQVSFSLSLDLQSYLQLIRQLSHDKESLGTFLDQMEAFLRGELGNDKSLESFLAEAGEQLGVTSVRIEQSTEIQFRGQIIIRNGDQIQVLNSVLQDQQAQSETIQEAEPLVFDLNGNGLELTTVEEGVLFDMQGNGTQVQTAFITGEDAFLALDRNQNGVIDSGKELFGDQHGALNGIEELRKFDDNRDNVIDAQDRIYEDLLLFVDHNGDGYSQQNELLSLMDEHIERIGLQAREEHRNIAGNRVVATISFERVDGTQGTAGEVYLNYLRKS